MASLAPSPNPGFCLEKQRLADEFLATVRQINDLQSAEANAIIERDTGLERFDLALFVAREARDKAKAAYVMHVMKHRC